MTSLGTGVLIVFLGPSSIGSGGKTFLVLRALALVGRQDWTLWPLAGWHTLGLGNCDAFHTWKTAALYSFLGNCKERYSSPDWWESWLPLEVENSALQHNLQRCWENSFWSSCCRGDSQAAPQNGTATGLGQGGDVGEDAQPARVYLTGTSIHSCRWQRANIFKCFIHQTLPHNCALKSLECWREINKTSWPFLDLFSFRIFESVSHWESWWWNCCGGF